MFNADLREVLKSQGLEVLHIREADRDGVFDLLITSGFHHWWMELKVGDRPLEPSQVDFAKSRKEGYTLSVARLMDGQSVSLCGSEGQNSRVIDDFRTADWNDIMFYAYP